MERNSWERRICLYVYYGSILKKTYFYGLKKSPLTMNDDMVSVL